MARLDALQSRVNTIKSVLAKTPKRPILDQNSSKKWHHSILSSMLIQLLTHLMVLNVFIVNYRLNSRS